MKKIVATLVLLAGIFSAASSQPRTIRVNAGQVAGQKSPVYTHCIGAGRAAEGLRADWQQQLALVQKQIGFNYIRFHGLLNDDMHVYSIDKQGNEIFNFQYVDKLYDFLLSIHIRPVVEFGFMPPDMASGTKTIFWWKGNVTLPKSWDTWETLIRKLVSHWQERYGETEVSKWYFEVWNEPDLGGFFAGTQADYFNLYAHTVKAVKSVSPHYRVGGPATSATKWITPFLKWCADEQLPVDFVSTHCYATISVLDEFGTKKQQLKSNADSLAKDVAYVRSQIDSTSYKNAELLFTEWNTSPSSRDPIHDSYQNASFMLQILKKAALHSNSMSYWTFTDIFEEAGPGPAPLHGGFGLINLQGLFKPSFFAYKFLAELGAIELKNNDENSIVCKSSAGYQALIWNFSFPNTGKEFDQGYFSKEQPPADSMPVTLALSQLASGTYWLDVYKVGYRQNDLFTAYSDLGKPGNLNRQQEARLKKLSSGEPVVHKKIKLVNGKFQQQFQLRDNDILFLKLTKAK